MFCFCLFTAVYAQTLTYTLFEDGTATGIGSNAILIDDGSRAVLIDTGSDDNVLATAVSNFIIVNQFSLEMIFITHGHPDHFGGVPSLSSNFSSVPIYVGSNAIRSELLFLVTFLNSSGFLTPEASTFPWFSEILVLPGDQILVFAQNPLFIQTDYLPAESQAFATVWDPTSEILLTGDLIYNLVNFYLGTGVDTTTLLQWMNDDFQLLRDRFPTAKAIYPGHGPLTTQNINDITAVSFQYLSSFLSLVRSCPGGRPQPLEVVAQSIASQFPNYAFPSIATAFIPTNLAWSVEQENWDCSLGSVLGINSLVCLSLFFILF